MKTRERKTLSIAHIFVSFFILSFVSFFIPSFLSFGVSRCVSEDMPGNALNLNLNLNQARDTVQDFSQVTVKPELTTELLVNPGKGWVLYNAPGNYPPETLALSSQGYTRFVWGDIEPQEGEFHWEKIDAVMNAWVKTGCRFAFGVCGASTHNKNFWASPKWVFDAGAKYDTFTLTDPKRPTAGIAGEKLVPIFNDPVYMEKLKHFIDAFAARYDGNPNISYIDIRSYGNWGEGHMYPFRKHDITAEEYLEHVKLYRSAFKKTLLALPVGGKITRYAPVYAWCIENGITLRRDGICGNSDGAETTVCDGKFPAVFELYGGYDFLKKLGWWDGIQDKDHCGYRLADCIETGKATWCNFGGDAALKAEPELIRTLGNRLGYHIVFTSMTFPRTLENGSQFSVTTCWENRGVAFLFLPSKITFALLDAAGNVIQTCDADASHPQDFASDTPVTLTDALTFRDVPDGTYTFAVGILPADAPEPKNAENPYIKLGVKLPVSSGWYKLADVKMTSAGRKTP